MNVVTQKQCVLILSEEDNFKQEEECLMDIWSFLFAFFGVVKWYFQWCIECGNIFLFFGENYEITKKMFPFVMKLKVERPEIWQIVNTVVSFCVCINTSRAIIVPTVRTYFRSSQIL